MSGSCCSNVILLDAHVAMVSALLALPACSGSKATEEITTTREACESFCEVMIDCGPAWAYELRDRENCSWKFGDDAAHDTCMKSCEWEGMEGFDEADEMECILCQVDSIGSSCGSRAEALEACPCVFDTYNYGNALPPGIEPLACDGGDEYIFSGNDTGPEFRERCLGGDMTYCW